MQDKNYTRIATSTCTAQYNHFDTALGGPQGNHNYSMEDCSLAPLAPQYLALIGS